MHFILSKSDSWTWVYLVLFIIHIFMVDKPLV